MFHGFNAGGGKLMGFAKILGCISLENIFAYISAFLYLYPLFFLAAFRLNAKDISSRLKSAPGSSKLLLLLFSPYHKLADSILVSATLPLFSFCAVQ